MALHFPLRDSYSIPAMGLGTYRLTGREGLKAIQTALDLGYTHLDTADAYHNHEVIGQAMKSKDRQELFITTKILPKDLGKQNAIQACKRFLKELDTPYIDLLLIHWPSPDIPLEETLEAFELIKERGLARCFGVSNFTIPLIERCAELAFPICLNQVEFHPYLNQSKLQSVCQKHHVRLGAYRPLGKGILSENETLNLIASYHIASPLQVAIAWLLSKEIVCTPKASSHKHLKENLEATSLKLSSDEIASIDQLNNNLRQVGVMAGSCPQLFDD